MDRNEENAQVQHMREFIIHEAKEKADEIKSKAEQDYNVEKQRLVEDEKLRLKKDFERRQNNVDKDSKIANATEMNKNKLEVLQAAALEMDSVFDHAFEQLKKIPAEPAKYQKLLSGLIAEGGAMLKLPECKVQCRAEDKAVVQKAIADTKVQGRTFKLDDTPLDLDDSVTMIPNDPKFRHCVGGVLVTSMDSKVRCSQTLNARLQVVYDTSLPIVKPMLFEQSGSKHIGK